VEPARDFAQLHLHCVDQIQWRSELIRPLVLWEEGTAAPRAQDTHTHPDTVRTFVRRCRQQGILGLLPDDVEVAHRRRASRVPETVRQELARLKALYTGFQYRGLVRIVFCTTGYRVSVHTIKKLGQRSPPAAQGELALEDDHSQPDHYRARLQVLKLYYQGWTKRSISRVLPGSRTTVREWIQRFEAEHFAGLVDKSRAPKAPARKVWFSLMIEVYHLQKRHPDAGGFRMWSLLAHTEISVRTVERIMALNRHIYEISRMCATKAPSHRPNPIRIKLMLPTNTGSLTVGRWILPWTGSHGGASSSWTAIPAPCSRGQWPQWKPAGWR
jgi:hypothetical protein